MESEKLLSLLRHCAHYLHHHSEGRGSQERIMMILSRKGSMSQHDLLEKVGVRSSSLSEVLTKLENYGCIERKKSQEDKRNVEIHITQLGRQKAAEVKEIHEQRAKVLFASLDEEEQVQLATLLEKLLIDWRQERSGRN